jgi:hypothetical protein
MCGPQVDALPFRQFFEQHYGTEVGKKKKAAKKAEGADDKVRLSSIPLFCVDQRPRCP